MIKSKKIYRFIFTILLFDLYSAIFLFLYLFIYLSIDLSIYLFIYLFYLFIYLFILVFLLYVLLNYYCHTEEGPKGIETFVLLELGFFFFKKYRFIKHAIPLAPFLILNDPSLLLLSKKYM